MSPWYVRGRTRALVFGLLTRKLWWGPATRRGVEVAPAGFDTCPTRRDVWMILKPEWAPCCLRWKRH